jgi:bifunctional DNA-binding transcriptional regulator/antitoxin component of YhaV-PrlF toxin-antitoxin module
MGTVTISPKVQVMSPEEIRSRLKLRVGQKMRAVACDDRIELVPVRPAEQLRGFCAASTRTRRENGTACGPVDASDWLDC